MKMNDKHQYNFQIAEGEMAQSLRTLYDEISEWTENLIPTVENCFVHTTFYGWEHDFIVSRVQRKEIIFEVIARCFWLAYANVKKKTISRKIREQEEAEDSENLRIVKNGLDYNEADSYDKDRIVCSRTVEKYSEKYVKNKIAELEYLESCGFTVPKFDEKPRKNAPRLDDDANLNMIIEQTPHKDIKGGKNTPKTLLHLTESQNITDSKKVSDTVVADAFASYDNLYDKAKRLTDYGAYVDEWINLWRYETNQKGTLIAKLAKHMSENHVSELNGELIELLFGKYRRAEQLQTHKSTVLYTPQIAMERYQIFEYDDLISLYFDQNKSYEEKKKAANIVLFIHWMEGRLVKRIGRNYPKLFDPYFKSTDNDSEARKTIYLFCKECWPIVEKYEKSGVYPYSNRKIDHALIKKIRKVTAMLSSFPCTGTGELAIAFPCPPKYSSEAKTLKQRKAENGIYRMMVANQSQEDQELTMFLSNSSTRSVDESVFRECDS